MPHKTDAYKVSVRLMTYMHASFIKEAMDGIMMQETNFKVEVVVGDDFSTDSTLDIIKSYHDTANIQIRILERRKGDSYWEMRQRIGRLYNFLNILENCEGQYVALLDGDDYWTDPLKLQKQVDFLDAHCDFSLVGCKARKLVDNQFIDDELGQPGIYKIHQIAQQNSIPTGSVMLRSTYIEDIPQWFLNCPIGDRPLFLFYARNGQIKIFNEVMCVYRIHNLGVWSPNNNEQNQQKRHEHLFRLFSILKDKFDTHTNDILTSQYFNNLFRIANYYFKNDDYEKLAVLITQLDNGLDSKGSVLFLHSLESSIKRKNAEIDTLKKIVIQYKESKSYKIGYFITNFLKLKGEHAK